ncbi:MAG: HDOD domain-containing protein [Desulfomicrobiaceae bacterium]
MGIFLLATSVTVAGLLLWWILRPAMRPRSHSSPEDEGFPQIAPPAPNATNEVLTQAIHHIYSGLRPAANLEREAVLDPISSATHTAIQHIARHFQRLSSLQASLALLNDPNVRMHDVAALVARDPVLSARVLQTANSPLFRTISTIKSIHTAVTILGLSNIKTLIAYGLLPQNIYQGSLHQIWFRNIWRHMADTAAITAAIAKAMPRLDGGMLYTAALMHDMGKLLLIPMYTSYPRSAYPSTLSEEKSMLTATHIHAAKILIEDIQLDSDLASLILFHHYPRWMDAKELNWKDDMLQCLAIIFLANQLAKCLSHDGIWTYSAELETLHDSFHTIFPQEQIARIVLDPAFQRPMATHVQAMQASLH